MGRTFCIRLSVALAVLGALWALYRHNSYYSILPVKFKKSDLPYVDVMIEGNSYPLVVDLGSRLEVDIHSDILRNLKRDPCGNEKWKNYLGQEFEQKTFILPEIDLGTLKFEKPVVVDFPAEHEKDYVIWRDPENAQRERETVGYLGRGLLKKVNMLLDMEHSKIVFSNSLRKLKKSGYPIQSYIKVPFSMEPKGIVVEVSTDFRKLRLLIDSGTTWTILHEYLFPEGVEKKVSPYGFPEIVSSTFDMGPAHFGEQKFYFMPMGEELKDIDGFIGMDFIKKHVMYIDFDHKMLYIQA